MDDERTQIVTVSSPIQAGLEDRQYCLEAVAGAEVGRRYLIGQGGVTFGRAPPADVVLSDSQVSRLHCRVALEGDELVVTDLQSTNGVYVDGARIAGSAPLKVGALLQIGAQSFLHERITRRQLEKSDELDRDLATASSYVMALLPPPLREGPIRAEWFYRPCALLGGDAFGYGALGDNKFVGYLVDVSGHGAGAALHSVAVMNLLRQRALPNTDMASPSEVLATLNAMFQMEHHAEMYFTIWYGVYDATTRRLEYASGGHHPAFLAPPGHSELTPLHGKNPLIGAIPGKAYRSEAIQMPPGATLYVFSDGVFEIITREGRQWGLADFLPLISRPPVEGVTEPQRLYSAVREIARPGELDDDFSLVVLTFD